MLHPEIDIVADDSNREPFEGQQAPGLMGQIPGRVPLRISIVALIRSPAVRTPLEVAVAPGALGSTLGVAGVAKFAWI